MILTFSWTNTISVSRGSAWAGRVKKCGNTHSLSHNQENLNSHSAGMESQVNLGSEKNSLDLDPYARAELAFWTTP